MESFNSILKRMQDKLGELGGGPVDPTGGVGTRLRVLAEEIFGAYTNINWLKNAMFAQTAVGEQLEMHALCRGLLRKSDLPSCGTLSFGISMPLTYDLEIPAETICATPGTGEITFRTTESGILEAGEISVDIAAASTQGGKDKNVEAGSVTIMVNPAPGIESVTNKTVFVGGVDAETDDELRERLLESYRNISNGTNAAFYKNEVLKFDGVYCASVVPLARGRGTVDIYIASKGALPSEELIEEIQKEISVKRELNVDVVVQPTTLVPVDTHAYLKVKEGYIYTEVKNECQKAIREYFEDLKIGDPVLVAAISHALYTTNGVENFNFLNTVTYDRIMDKYQLAVCGDIQLTKVE